MVRLLRWGDSPIMVDDGPVPKVGCARCEKKVSWVNMAGLCRSCLADEREASD